MRAQTNNISLLLITLGIFTLNFTPVFAQEMVVQIIGGGYRFDGPATITFTPITAITDNTVNSDISIRSITSGGYREPPGGGEDGFIAVEDQNGGSVFQVQVQANGPLIHTTPELSYQIPLTNFLVKNTTELGPGDNDIDTEVGRSDGFTLNEALNNFSETAPPANPNNLTVPRVLGSGTGQQPGKWKFYPGFRIIIPPATAIGNYETSLTFTII